MTVSLQQRSFALFQLLRYAKKLHSQEGCIAWIFSTKMWSKAFIFYTNMWEKSRIFHTDMGGKMWIFYINMWPKAWIFYTKCRVRGYVS